MNKYLYHWKIIIIYFFLLYYFIMYDYFMSQVNDIMWDYLTISGVLALYLLFWNKSKRLHVSILILSHPHLHDITWSWGRLFPYSPGRQQYMHIYRETWSLIYNTKCLTDENFSKLESCLNKNYEIAAIKYQRTSSENKTKYQSELVYEQLTNFLEKSEFNALSLPVQWVSSPYSVLRADFDKYSISLCLCHPPLYH